MMVKSMSSMVTSATMVSGWQKSVSKRTRQDKNTSKKKSKKESKKFVSRETDNDQVSNKAPDNSSKSKATTPTLSKDAQRKLAAEQRKLTAPIRREIEETEKTLAKIDETACDA